MSHVAAPPFGATTRAHPRAALLDPVIPADLVAAFTCVCAFAATTSPSLTTRFHVMYAAAGHTSSFVAG